MAWPAKPARLEIGGVTAAELALLASVMVKYHQCGYSGNTGFFPKVFLVLFKKVRLWPMINVWKS